MPESASKWDGEKYDCKPGLAGWKRFMELLVINSASADKAGFSLLQNLLRDDEGARDADNEDNPRARDSNNHAILDLDNPGGGYDQKEIALRKRLYRARVVDSFHMIYHSINNQEIRTILAQKPYLLNGPLAFEYVKSLCCLPANEQDQWTLQTEWNDTTIANDIGYHFGSIGALYSRLSNINLDLEPEHKRSDNAMGSKILICIMNSSSLLNREAATELNAAAGDRNANPDARRFQKPAQGGGWTRDVRALVNYFEAAWTAAIEANLIAVKPPTKASKSKPPTSRASMPQTGLVARDAPSRPPGLGGYERGLTAIDRGSTVSERQDTIRILAADDVSVTRSTTTTSDLAY